MSDHQTAANSKTSTSNVGDTIKAKCIVQQCLNARLRVNLEANNEESFVEVILLIFNKLI